MIQLNSLFYKKYSYQDFQFGDFEVANLPILEEIIWSFECLHGIKNRNNDEKSIDSTNIVTRRA